MPMTKEKMSENLAANIMRAAVQKIWDKYAIRVNTVEVSWNDYSESNKRQFVVQALEQNITTFEERETK